jgi:hypothetical protein
MLEHSAEIGMIAAALSVAQGGFEKIRKDTENPFFKSKYAPLANVVEATRKALALQKLSVVQSVDAADGKCLITTMLVHESGQWFKGTLPVPVAKMDAQGVGSASTYGRRYALSAMLGVAADDDDDGNAASKPVQNQTTAVDPEELANRVDAIIDAADLESAKMAFAAVYKWASAAKDTDAQKHISTVWEEVKKKHAKSAGLLQSRMQDAKDAVAK